MIKFGRFVLTNGFITCKQSVFIQTRGLSRHYNQVPRFNTQFVQPCRYFSNLTPETEIDFPSICHGDEVLEKKLRIIALEVDIMRQDGKLVPEHITTENWQELLKLESLSQRKSFLIFLFKTEKKKENEKLKKEVKRKEWEERKVEPKPEDDGQIHYGFNGSTIFLRIYDTTIDRYDNLKLIQAMMFSQDIVIDCGYDEFMTPREQNNCAKQLMLLFAENRQHKDPYNIQFCNADPHSAVMSRLQKHIPNMYEPSFPLNTTPQSYLDLYPKEKLVYLTPHCKAELEPDYDHDSVYIIGALVDKTNHDPLSLAKAKREGLRMAKLPIDKHLIWDAGGCKNLTINQMIRIMLDWRLTNDWDFALKHIPRRKILTDEKLQKLNPNLTRKDALMKKLEYRERRERFGLNQNTEFSKHKKNINVRSLFNE